MEQQQLDNLKKGDWLVLREDESEWMEFLGWTESLSSGLQSLDSREWWGPCWADSNDCATIFDIDGKWLCDHGEGALLYVPDGKGFFVTKQELLDDFNLLDE
jgi:hypothetical protein